MDLKNVYDKIVSSFHVICGGGNGTNEINQANQYVSSFFMQNRADNFPKELLVKLLHGKHSPQIRFFALRILEVQIGKKWNSNNPKIDEFKKGCFGLLIELAVQIPEPPSRNDFPIVEKLSQLFVRVIYFEWPEKQKTLFENVLKKLIGKQKIYLALKVVNNFTNDVLNEYSLDKNVKKITRLRNHFLEGQIFQNIINFLLHNLKKQVHLRQILENLKGIFKLLIKFEKSPLPKQQNKSLKFDREKLVIKFLPFLIKLVKKEDFQDLSYEIFENCSNIFKNGKNLNNFVLLTEKTFTLNTEKEIKSYCKIYKNLSDKLRYFNEQIFIKGFMKVFSLPPSKLVNLDPYFKRMILLISQVYGKFISNVIANKKIGDQSKLTEIKNILFVLLQKSLILVIKKKEMKYKENVISTFYNMFSVIVKIIPDKIVVFILKFMYVYNYSNTDEFMKAKCILICKIFQFMQKLLNIQIKKKAAKNYNMVLKKILDSGLKSSKDVYLTEEVIKTLKFFDVCFGSNEKALTSVIKSLFQINKKELIPVVLGQWIEICRKYPKILFKFFKQIFNISKEIKKFYNLKQLIKFYQGCVELSNQNPNKENRASFLSFLLSTPLKKILSPEFKNSVSSTENLLNYLLKKKATDIFNIVALFASVGKSLKDDSISGMVIKILPTVFQTVKVIHSVYNPNVLGRIPNNMRKSFFWDNRLFGNFFATSFKDLKINLYEILGYCCEKKVQAFWGNKNLISMLSGSVFSNFQNLPNCDVGNIITHFLTPFTRSCPRGQGHFMLLSVVLKNVFKQISMRINNRKFQFSNDIDEIEYLREEDEFFKKLAKFLSIFKRSKKDDVPNDLYDFLVKNGEIYFTVIEIFIKYLHCNVLKRFGAFKSFFSRTIESFSKQNKFEMILYFYLFKVLIHLISFQKDLHFQVDIIEFISILYQYSFNSKYSNGILACVNKNNVKSLQAYFKNGKLTFRTKKRQMKNFLKGIIGKGVLIKVDMASSVNSLDKVFEKYDNNYVQKMFSQKRREF